MRLYKGSLLIAAGLALSPITAHAAISIEDTQSIFTDSNGNGTLRIYGITNPDPSPFFYSANVSLEGTGIYSVFNGAAVEKDYSAAEFGLNYQLQVRAIFATNTYLLEFANPTKPITASYVAPFAQYQAAQQDAAVTSFTPGSWQLLQLIDATGPDGADEVSTNVDGGVISYPTTFPVSGVPEPSTWAMMLLGFGGLGFLTYRKARGGSAAPLLAA